VDGRIDYNTMPLAQLDLAKFRQHLLQAGDLVITRSGRVGTTAVFDEHRLPVLPGAFLIRFRLRADRADPKFYMYFFNSPEGQHLLGSVATGSAQQNLNITSVHRLRVPMPPLSVQRRISGILGALDDKIELNRRMSQTLESLARALFKSWFVDFDPIRAKVEGRDPGCPDVVGALFPNCFEDSYLGEVPAGWRVGPLVEEFCLTMGQSPPGETYNDAGDGLPFYQGRSDFGARFPERRVFCTAPTRVANPGDTLVSVIAPVGDINIATEACAIGRGVAALRHAGGSISYTYLMMASLRDVLAAFDAEGTVFGAINRDAFRELSVLAPQPAVIQAFGDYVSAIERRLLNLHSQRATVGGLRDQLLSRLVSGQIATTSTS
jgi:type I restriction enzyme S subunit